VEKNDLPGLFQCLGGSVVLEILYTMKLGLSFIARLSRHVLRVQLLLTKEAT
jgi:hypothetical protein